MIDNMITAKDLFDQIRELEKLGGNTKFHLVYRDKDGNVTTVSSDDIKNEKPTVKAPVYDKTFYEAISALHSDKNALYIEAEGTKKRISLASNDQYVVSPASINTYSVFRNIEVEVHCVSSEEMGKKWLVKYKPMDSFLDFDQKPESAMRERDVKGRFKKKDN